MFQAITDFWEMFEQLNITQNNIETTATEKKSTAGLLYPYANPQQHQTDCILVSHDRYKAAFYWNLNEKRVQRVGLR